jgi:hypothetical protein
MRNLSRSLLLAAFTAALWLALARPAHAQWTNDPWNGMTAVTNETGSDSYPQIAHLGSGYTLVIWVRPDGDDPRIKFQILDQEGQALLGPIGAYMFDGNWQYGCERYLIPDGAGGAICVVSDARSGYRDIYGQRFDSQGNLLWGATGLPLAEWPGLQDMILYDVATSSNGEFFFTWNVQDGTGHTDLYIQKADNSGNRLWGAFGVPVGTGPGSQAYSQVVPDAAGGALVLWEDSRANPYTYNLYAQHLDQNGAPLLQTNGIPVLDLFGQQIEMGILEDGATDGRGGGIWVYTTPGSSNHLDVIRVNGQGQLLWLWYSPYYGSHYIYDVKRHGRSNTVWICAYDNRPGASATYLYQFDIRGNPLFGSGGIPYGGGSLSETSDGMIVFRPYQVGGGTRFSAVRVNSGGRIAWVTDVALASEVGVFTNPVGASDGADGAVVAFEDWRQYPTTQVDIFAQRVQYNGQLGNPMAPQMAAWTEPLDISILSGNLVEFTLPLSGHVKSELFDLLGRRIATLSEGFKSAGVQTIRIDDNNLPSGLYLMRLTTSSGQQVRKLTITR